jgi:hypothetical protein
MSRVESLDLAALRARLIVAIEGCDGLEGASPESSAELGLWASLFDLQAEIEGVNGTEILATLANVTAVVS